MDPPPIAVRMAGDTQLIVVRGVVERDGAREIDYLVRHGAPDAPAELIIDLSETEEVTGALIGALLRASRRLAWRNRRLKIVCPQADLRGRLVIAGLDELADVAASLDDP
jgi:anti-anti-sigma regulatory factor